MRLIHSLRATLMRVYRTERVTTKLPPREYLCSVRQRRRSRRYRDQMRGRRRQVPLTRKIYMLQENRRCLSCRRNGKVPEDRKSTRLNSSHVAISYAVFCLKKKKTYTRQ